MNRAEKTASVAEMTASTCFSRAVERMVSRAGNARMSTPGRRSAATARPKLMRFSIAPVFIHDSPVSGQPLGAWCPKIGSPRYAIICAVRGVLSGAALRARIALTTTSKGDFTLLRNACCEKNSGDVMIERRTSRISPSVLR